MKSLHALVSRYGEPSALVDHHDPHSKRFAIWDWADTMELCGEQIRISSRVINGNIFDVFQDQLDRWKKQSGEVSVFGFISYDAKDIFFPHIPFKKPGGSLPKIWFGKPGKVIEYSPDDSDEPVTHTPVKLQRLNDQITKEKYIRDLSKIRINQEKGNVYQVNYTFPQKYGGQCRPFELYLALRRLAKPANGMYLKTDRFSILSVSPERFIRTSGAQIETFPIKGTRKRNNDPARDKALAKELSMSEKDRAEHLMIVDLMRNDLGKICTFGSVTADNLFGIHSFPSVHHMISRISGRLKPGIREFDIFKAVFPGGSITGAPKEAAVRIIDKLENYPRGIYTGSLGFITPAGDMDFNIAIRTLTMEGGIGVYPVGGGIVWDSNPADEWNEAIQKSKILSSLLETKNET